jgi:hypothetical protein
MTSTPLFVDNTSAIQLAKNPKFHDRTKHINTKYHLIRHHVEAKTIHNVNESYGTPKRLLTVSYI